ncbi:MAG: hypothetical protein FGM15_05995 [Chthoniobacterales bacterium]|nr:hypothetical protein [Chthoniobacterales bacterium]
MLIRPLVVRLGLLAVVCIFASGSLHAAMLAKSEGAAKVLVNSQESPAASLVNSTLAPGTTVSTGEDGKVMIEVAPGIVIELQPNSQVTIGEMSMDKITDELGNPIPQYTITLTLGTIVAVHSDSGLADAALLVVTPRGNISPVLPGQTVITVDGSNPETSTVTVASVTGSEIATTTEGEQIPVAEGTAVILKPDNTYQAFGINELPNGGAIQSLAQNVATEVSNQSNLTPAVPPPIIPPPPPVVPPNIPPAEPTPTPTPAPVSP